MNAIVTERMINRARLIFIVFIALAGLSSWRSGSAQAVYLSIFAADALYLAIVLLNFAALRRGVAGPILVYGTLTFEIALIFTVKYAFHFDPGNGYGMSIKEPATFLVYFLFGIMNGLRYDKRLNIYFGVIACLSYCILLALAVFDGGLVFTSDPGEFFSADKLRASTEISKVLFLVFFTYFLQLMADFTSKNTSKIESAKKEADSSLATIGNLLGAVKSTAGALAEGNRELSTSTESIGTVINETYILVREITEITNNFQKGIGEIRKKIQAQNRSIEDNFVMIDAVTGLMEEIYRDSLAQKELADNALRLAMVNETRIQETSASIRDMEANSRKIEAISGAINEIADRTNLLALNAAIESARAGDYGRGFAVVADEITKLAGQSSDSAREITTIIKSTVGAISGVARAVEDMSEGLREIIGYVRNESGFVQRLSARAEKENADSRRLDAANREIDRNTKEVISYFNEQTELILRILEWTEKLTDMTELVSGHLNRLMVLSHTLSTRTGEIDEVMQSTGCEDVFPCR